MVAEMPGHAAGHLRQCCFGKACKSLEPRTPSFRGVSRQQASSSVCPRASRVSKSSCQCRSRRYVQHPGRRHVSWLLTVRSDHGLADGSYCNAPTTQSEDEGTVSADRASAISHRRDPRRSRQGPTTLGAQIEVTDRQLVKIFRAEGGIPFCKTNVPQTLLAFECANPIFGASSNPYSSARSPGGSSGGEAALITLRGTPIGWGSDSARAAQSVLN